MLAFWCVFWKDKWKSLLYNAKLGSFVHFPWSGQQTLHFYQTQPRHTHHQHKLSATAIPNKTNFYFLISHTMYIVLASQQTDIAKYIIISPVYLHSEESWELICIFQWPTFQTVCTWLWLSVARSFCRTFCFPPGWPAFHPPVVGKIRGESRGCN